jgi:hypothetical protein
VLAFDQNGIADLISCPKEILEAPRKEMRLEGAHWRNDAILKASNGMEGEFTMLMRRCEDFRENFSIGLVYNPRDGRSAIPLLRCNGPHGDFNRGFDPSHAHFYYHIHRATAEAIAAGESPERCAEKTTEFASYSEALQFFVRAVNLNAKDSQRYFPAGIQIDFTFE